LSRWSLVLLKTLLAAAALLGLAACASGEGRDQGPTPAQLAQLKNTPGLFISPCGQPFRSEPGEPYPVVKWFAQADRNGDGRIDRAEFRADAEAFFKLLDLNHDGVIDGFELANYERTIVPEILGAYRGGVSIASPDEPREDGGHRERGPHGEGPRGEGRRGGGGRSPDVLGLQGAVAYELFSKPEPVAAADLNVDGHVRLAEFLRVADQDFDTLDKTGRGYLTLSDLPQTPLQAALEGRAKKRR
jgi:hypothetical protein